MGYNPDVNDLHESAGHERPRLPLQPAGRLNMAGTVFSRIPKMCGTLLKAEDIRSPAPFPPQTQKIPSRKLFKPTLYIMTQWLQYA